MGGLTLDSIHLFDDGARKTYFSGNLRYIWNILAYFKYPAPTGNPFTTPLDVSPQRHSLKLQISNDYYPICG